jgi:phosphate transport system protein
VLGADLYETEEEDRASPRRSLPPLGIGEMTCIEGANTDKNARVVRRRALIRAHGGEPDREERRCVIRDGVVVVPKNAVISDGALISTCASAHRTGYPGSIARDPAPNRDKESCMLRHFDQDLERLREKLLRMAGIIEAMIRTCLNVLRGGDRAALEKEFDSERQVNRLHRELAEDAVLLIARHQPVADDLRLIVSVLNINTDLERMGDQAINISRKILDLTQISPGPVDDRLAAMLETVQDMVVRAVNAFVSQDVAAAEGVIRADDEVDAARDEVTRAVVSSIPGDRTAACGLVESLLAARNIERIADHATNVAENVIYLVQGKDVRHQIGESHETPGSWRQVRHIAPETEAPVKPQS